MVTCTVGGTISGYCAIGRITSAPSPISVMNTLTTVARIGRSMKRCVKRMASLQRAGPGWPVLGADRRSVRVAVFSKDSSVSPA